MHLIGTDWQPSPPSETQAHLSSKKQQSCEGYPRFGFQVCGFVPPSHGGDCALGSPRCSAGASLSRPSHLAPSRERLSLHRLRVTLSRPEDCVDEHLSEVHIVKITRDAEG